MSPTQTKAWKDRAEPTKTLLHLSIYFKEGEDDLTTANYNCLSGSFRQTPKDVSTNVDWTSEPIKESEPIKSASRRSRRVRKLTKFYQMGLDYVTYTNARDRDHTKKLWLHQMLKHGPKPCNPKWTRFMKIELESWSKYQLIGNHYLVNGSTDTSMCQVPTEPSTNLGLLSKVSNRNMGSTTMKSSRR